jgi:hypothetical protein
MKALLGLLLLLVLGSPAQAADNGLWYNASRSGEGINLITRDNTAVVFFYTYSDVITEVPPVVSPAPPEVDPMPANLPIWFYGQADDYDGDSATGTLYVGEAFEYPASFENEVGVVDAIGTFTLTRQDDGWVMDVSYLVNDSIPWYASIYSTFTFETPLLTD